LCVIREIDPENKITVEQIRTYLRNGFPWHTPEQPHLDIFTAEQWWEGLYPTFQRAFEAANFEAIRAEECSRKVRPVYTNIGNWALYDDTIPALQNLASRGWTHAVLSNHVPELPDILRQLELGDYLDRIFCSAQIGYEKPHPDAFKTVLAAYPEANPTWMIGDNPEADFAGARRCGLRAILARKPHPGIELFAPDLFTVEEILEDLR
jgi:HAD superfamily hydrolase (TIGR01549 family)